MGFKITNLQKNSTTTTTTKIKKNQTNPSSTSSSTATTYNITQTNKMLYKKYKKFYTHLLAKYPQSKDRIALNSIMSKGMMGTKVTSEQNRELALLDIDKLISLSHNSLTENGAQMATMRMIVDMEGVGQSIRDTTRRAMINEGIRNQGIREQEDQNTLINRVLQMGNGNINEEHQEEDVIVNEEYQINMGQQADDLGNERITRLPQRNSLAIMRIVRAARLHFLMAQNHQIPNNRHIQQTETETTATTTRRVITSPLNQQGGEFNTQQQQQQQQHQQHAPQSYHLIPSSSVQNIQHISNSRIQQDQQSQQDITPVVAEASVRQPVQSIQSIGHLTGQ